MTDHSAMQLTDVGVCEGGTTILHGLTFDLPKSGLVAVIGPNGAGKTTLLRAMIGLQAFTGTIRYNGSDLATMPRIERARRMGYLAQGHAIHWPLSARDVVALGRHAHGLSDPVRMTGDHASIVDAALARCNMQAFADRPLHTLSGGERARVMLARVLAGQPDVIMADEPIAALDPRHQLTVMADLKAESKAGRLVVLVTHDLALAARFADRVILLAEGRLLANGTAAEVLTPENLAKAYGILALHQTHQGQSVIVPWQALEP